MHGAVKLMPPLPRVLAVTQHTSHRPNNYMPPRAPTEAKDLAAKCPQVQNSPLLHHQHSESQRLGYLSSSRNVDR